MTSASENLDDAADAWPMRGIRCADRRESPNPDHSPERGHDRCDRPLHGSFLFRGTIAGGGLESNRLHPRRGTDATLRAGGFAASSGNGAGSEKTFQEANAAALTSAAVPLCLSDRQDARTSWHVARSSLPVSTLAGQQWIGFAPETKAPGPTSRTTNFDGGSLARTNHHRVSRRRTAASGNAERISVREYRGSSCVQVTSGSVPSKSKSRDTSRAAGTSLSLPQIGLISQSDIGRTKPPRSLRRLLAATNAQPNDGSRVNTSRPCRSWSRWSQSYSSGVRP